MLLRHAAEWIVAGTIFGTILISPLESGAAEDPTVEMARARFREGVQFYDKQQYEKARLAFLQAYALKPHPSVLLNLAQSELRGGRPADAATHFAEYLKTAGAAGAEKQDAESGLAAAKAKVGEITVSSDTSGAQIVVDGENRGVTPLAAPVFVTPGRHVVEVRSGERKVSKPVTLAAGQSTSLDLPISGSAVTSAAAATSHAEAGPTPGAAKESKPPAGAGEQEAEPKEEPQEQVPVEASVEEHHGRGFFGWLAAHPVAMATGVVGAVGLAAGGTFGILAWRDFSSRDDIGRTISNQWNTVDYPELLRQGNLQGDSRIYTMSAPCSIQPVSQPYLVTPIAQYQTQCARYVDADNAGRTKRTIAIVSTAVGGAALIGTFVYYFVDTSGSSGETAKTRGQPRRFQARVVPLLGPAMNGVGVAGRF